MRTAFLAFLSILASATTALASDILVMEAYARASAAPNASSGAAYVSLKNQGEADRLLSITSPQAAVAHLHETKSTGDVMSMEMVDTLDLAAATTLSMKPGGLHIMLTGLKAPLKKGEKLLLELTFEKAGKLAVEALVGSVAQGVGG